MTTRNHLRRFASSAKEDENLANPTAWNARLRAWMMAMAPGTATWMLKREAPTNATHTAATLGNVIGLASFVWAVQQFFDEKRPCVRTRSSRKAARAPRADQARNAQQLCRA
jgi:hypothetical protein